MKITVQNLGCVFAIIFGYSFVAPLTCLGYKITDKWLLMMFFVYIDYTETIFLSLSRDLNFDGYTG